MTKTFHGSIDKFFFMNRSDVTKKKELDGKTLNSVEILRFFLKVVMRLYLFVGSKSLLIVNYIIKSLYSMVKINLEYFHCITYSRT